jgi:hypothetical protein
MARNPLPDVVKQAILKVARAYQEKGNTPNAIRTIRRLETTYGEEYTNQLIARELGK